MSKAALLFVHLSDIHFCKADLGSAYDLDEDLRRLLVADARAMASKLERPSGILISGDIAFHGRKEEYDTAREWLDNELCYTVGVEPSGVWCVPGNHDVDRSIIKEKPSYEDARKEIRQCLPNQIDSFLRRHLKEPEKLYTPITAFNWFAEQFGCDIDAKRPVWDTEDKLTLNDGTILRIYGLNSSLISDSNDDVETGKMVLGTQQVLIPQDSDVENVVLCHHPPDWLRDGDMVEETLKPRCRLQLFGHKHRHRLTTIDSAFVRIAAGAVHPSRSEQEWEPRYNWLKLWVDADGPTGRTLKVLVFPRIWNKTDQKFSADRHNTDAYEDFKSVALPLDPKAVPCQKSATVALAIVGHNEQIESDNSSASGDEEASVEVRDSRGNPIMDRERALVRRYLTLGYVQRMRVATDLGLLKDGDDELPEGERHKLQLKRAKEDGILDRLWDQVEEEHGDGRYPVNPFAEPIRGPQE